VPWPEAATAGNLIGQKLVLNEFVAYGSYYETGQLSAHSQAVVSFALCGFANFSSIAILIGGLGTLAPARRAESPSLACAPSRGASWPT
jgi:CNT family concentrative nucleoside transporter